MVSCRGDTRGTDGGGWGCPGGGGGAPDLYGECVGAPSAAYGGGGMCAGDGMCCWEGCASNGAGEFLALSMLALLLSPGVDSGVFSFITVDEAAAADEAVAGLLASPLLSMRWFCRRRSCSFSFFCSSRLRSSRLRPSSSNFSRPFRFFSSSDARPVCEYLSAYLEDCGDVLRDDERLRRLRDDERFVRRCESGLRDVRRFDLKHDDTL